MKFRNANDVILRVKKSFTFFFLGTFVHSLSEVPRLYICHFNSYSMKHHEWVSIDAPPHNDACCWARIDIEKFTLMAIGDQGFTRS